MALSSCPMVYSSLDKDPSSCWVYQGDVGPVEWTVNACKADIVFPQRKVHLIQNMLLVFIMVIFPCQTVPMQLLFDNLGIILSQHVGHTKFFVRHLRWWTRTWHVPMSAPRPEVWSVSTQVPRNLPRGRWATNHRWHHGETIGYHWPYQNETRHTSF